MPAFDLLGIRVGKYVNTAGTITYTTPTGAGDAMTANLELRFAEGRLYAEGKLAEMLKLATGGSISLGVKYIPAAAQKMMYGATDDSVTVGTETVTGIKFTAKDNAAYVGVGFYAPDMVDGVKKYTCVFVPKALFGPPSMTYQTKGESITFQTPTTTGEFLPSDAADELMLKTAVVDNAQTAVNWIKACLGETVTEPEEDTEET